ncbi:hypothetical protein [Trichocoleus sp. FACHB-40]|uniref:hypothetical protein n=1 Tax=Trichocoleus sp. FACHB-40 TaxID=2692870 RepID=UPI00168725F0|nr:hypothetical protein [Trichocoleus sp. FACHB-40]MBD2006488.1 hypothetical protein [Trichocoleus sp. FACHB-40]
MPSHRSMIAIALLASTKPPLQLLSDHARNFQHYRGNRHQSPYCCVVTVSYWRCGRTFAEAMIVI